MGQGVVIVWRPDGLPHAVRTGPQGIEIAQLPLTNVQNGEALELFMVARGGAPTRWIDDTFIQQVQGDFEILYETPDTANPPERAAFDIASLQFVPTRLPCNHADLALDYDVLDLSDVSAFVDGFVAMDQSVDLNGDTLLDLQDVGVFVAEFVAGCP